MSVRNGDVYAKGRAIDVNIDVDEFGDCDSELSDQDEENVEHSRSTPELKSSVVKGNRASLEGAVLKFEKIMYLVGKGKREKIIVKDVSATVTHGRKFCRLNSCVHILS